MTPQTQDDASTLADKTVQALSGSPTDVDLTDGTTLINSWLGVLGENSPLSNALTTLKETLQSETPDTANVGTILKSLSQQTAAASAQTGGEAQGPLQQLAAALERFADQL